ncbi:hypothetical protein ACFYOF_18580 [Streptomyces sp. NPDC007148]
MTGKVGVDHDTLVTSLPKQNGMLAEVLIDSAEIARTVLLASTGAAGGTA